MYFGGRAQIYNGYTFIIQRERSYSYYRAVRYAYIIYDDFTDLYISIQSFGTLFFWMFSTHLWIFLCFATYKCYHPCLNGSNFSVSKTHLGNNLWICSHISTCFKLYFKYFWKRDIWPNVYFGKILLLECFASLILFFGIEWNWVVSGSFHSIIL